MADQTENESYHLVLKGPGITIDKVVDVRIAGAIAQMTFAGVGALPAATDQRAGQKLTVPSTPGQRLSLREFLQTTVAGRGIHIKILAVGRYLRDHEQQDDFGRDEVRARFRSAGEPQPANFARDFQKAVRAGWIAEDHQNTGRFYVTRTGDEEIDRRQDQGASSAPSLPRRRSRRSTASEDPDQ